MVTVTRETTDVVVIKKVAEEAPAGTVTEAGTVAALVLELDKVTTAPPGGAGAFSTTELEEPAGTTPPVTVVGERTTDDRLTGLTVTVAGIDAPA